MFEPMETIRIGLLIDNVRSLAWVGVMLEEIQREPGVEIVLVVRNASPSVRRPLLRRIWDNRTFALYQLWRLVDRRLFPASPDAFGPCDLGTILDGVPVIEVTPIETKFSDTFAAADIERIREYRVDLFLRLGFRILRGNILTVAPVGVWSFHHGDNHVNRGGPPGVWEVLLNDPATGSILQILTEELDGGRELYRSWSTTHRFSLNRNLNPLYWKTLSFVPRRLRELRLIGLEAFLSRYAPRTQEPVFYSRPLYMRPRNGQAVALLARLMWRATMRALGKLLWREQWTLFYRLGSLGGSSDVLFRYRELRPPADRFWADPCIVEEEGRYLVFFEESEYRHPIARISLIEFDANGRPIGNPRTILEGPTHYSYPCVFKDGDNWFMIVESQQTRTIPLYRCSVFPDQWEFVMNLMQNVSAVDATVWRHEGRYWLFTAINEHDGASSSEELFLFSSPTLQTTEWQAHPANPIVSDTHRARPAGRVFEYAGSWYRPAQDCSGFYGRAMVLHRVNHISESDYSETVVSRIDPAWNPRIIATHTFTQAGRLSMVDALCVRSRWTRGTSVNSVHGSQLERGLRGR
jgi:hypothetical protein